MIRTGNGLFIVIEGIDGSGKSTLVSSLFDRLKSSEPTRVIHKLREPGDSPAGRKIRHLLVSRENPTREQWCELFLEDREQDVSVNIRPALERNEIVVLDRYAWSTAAYQGDELEPTAESILHENWKRGFPRPDLLIFLALSPEQAMERIRSRSGPGNLEHFEKLETLKRIHDNFQKILPETTLQLDANLPPETLAENAFQAVQNIKKEPYRHPVK